MRSGGRLDHIHGLRGVAALGVVVQHALQVVHEAGLTELRPLLDHVNLGRFGVVLFFLISGFVVPFSFRGDRPLRHFALSRFFRLYPAYWLSIPVLAALAMLAGRTPTPGAMLANATMLQTFFGEADVGPGYWSLKFELCFYLLCALMFWRGRLNDPIFNGVLVGAALSIAALPVFGNMLGARNFINTDNYFIATFFLGMLLRRAFVDRCVVARNWSLALVPLTMLTGLLLSGLIEAVPDNGNRYFLPGALGVAMSLPVLALVLVLWLKPAVPRAVMALGTISYSLYLFQDVGLHLLPYAISPSRYPASYVAAVLVVSIAVAAMVYRLVERPMIALGRRLADQPARRPVAATF